MNRYRRWLALVPRGLRLAIDRHESQIAHFARHAAEATPSGSRVLDVGAGESRFRPHFGHARYVAVDFALGESAWDYSTLDVVGDVHALPIAGAAADVVLCTQVLEHVADPQRVFIEIARVLKPGATLFLTAPQGAGEHQQPHDYFRFTSFSLRLLARRAGLEVVDVRPMGGFFVYLGSRIALTPKYLFSGVRRRATRWLLMPVELVALAVLSGVVPLLCYAVDGLDRRRDLTLGYAMECRRPAPGATE